MVTTEINLATDTHIDLRGFLAKHSAKQSPGVTYTHTRIPDKSLNIFGGSYIIPEEDETEFYRLYHKHIFIDKKKEYLTEKQLENVGPIVVDFDFRYRYDIDTKQHTYDHISDMVVLYVEELAKMFVFTDEIISL